MKQRQIEIFHILMNNQAAEISMILDLYGISRRTLFYDVREINYNIAPYGTIYTNKQNMILKWEEVDAIAKIEDSFLKPYFKASHRKALILYDLMEHPDLTLDDLVQKMDVSKSTIVNDVKDIKKTLSSIGISMYYSKQYHFDGDEFAIRNLYLELLGSIPFKKESIDSEVIRINQEYDYCLSDYNLFYLSKFIRFIKARINQGHFIKSKELKVKYNRANIPERFLELIISNNEDEKEYFTQYLLSILSIESEKVNKITYSFVNELFKQLNMRMSLRIDKNEKVFNDLIAHLKVSYLRIVFKFPAYNSEILNIKVKYFYLFQNIKATIRIIDMYPFSTMSDEEIGYIVMYIGSYLYEKNSTKKIAFVCPQGKAISQHLLLQFVNHFPNTEIIGTFSIHEADTISKICDHVISTIDIPSINNLIKVNPILSNVDIEILKKKMELQDALKNRIEEIMQVVKKHAKISDENQLYLELNNILKKEFDVKGYEPMLHELLTEDKIQHIESAENWEKAIELAAQPLLKDDSIEPVYIQNMIKNVHKFGPYIVLTDGFALAHASSEEGVNRLGMSLMTLKNPVDFEGRPVQIILVMANTDNKSHLKALTTLTRIISNKETLDKIKTSSSDEIIKLIKEEEQ
ncbi:MAG: transcription antiterminator [Solobacterium sp.]|jgi:mannitol operon transcriptional antiterminator|nr:transcription antiterminator [Solobacterium sp.]MBD9216441.1 transcription antiterminator [Solobacterium sp.]